MHFTEDVLGRIKAKGIDMETVCLHVGAGTFLPVKSSLVSEHPMHREPFVVKLQLLKDICRMDRKLIAVGTTSVRTLESLYYVGVSCLEKGVPEDVPQWAPYEREYPYSTRETGEYLNLHGQAETSSKSRLLYMMIDSDTKYDETVDAYLVHDLLGSDSIFQWREFYMSVNVAALKSPNAPCHTLRLHLNDEANHKVTYRDFHIK